MSGRTTPIRSNPAHNYWPRRQRSKGGSGSLRLRESRPQSTSPCHTRWAAESPCCQRCPRPCCRHPHHPPRRRCRLQVSPSSTSYRRTQAPPPLQPLRTQTPLATLAKTWARSVPRAPTERECPGDMPPRETRDCSLFSLPLKRCRAFGAARNARRAARVLRRAPSCEYDHHPASARRRPTVQGSS